ncbi:MAG: hypothetical protein M1365_03995 [Actinobacteria bacterium]|nr:hypothetical protein [Actinomycetota bacterium]
MLISKDSNIGEAVILDKDYPNFMISGGLYKLPVSNNKLYLLAFLKTEFFKKQLYSLVSRGSTLKHAKTLFLDCYIPFPKNDKVITYVEKLVNALLNKELEIKNKHYLINEVIQNELKNQNDKNLKLSYPSLKDISLKSRIDTGTYTTEFQTIDFQIKNYVNGFTQIPENNISSGNTPTERKISSSDEYENLWITPTSISDFGTIMNYETIRCKQNNLNSNALLIINRTSRGEEGEYVGISTFYDYSEYGKGHHNQGIYKVKNLPDEDLIFLASCLNSALWRKYCGRLSLGSKMKEIKASQVASIPFPNFPKNIKLQINKLYFDQPINMKDSNDYLEFDSNWNKEAGILQLNKSYRKTKQFLQNLLINLIQGEPIEIKFSKELLY